jgi:TonB family protein
MAARLCKALLLATGIALALPVAAQEVVKPVDSDTDRVPANTVIPEYPEKARLERIEGEVQVCFYITREGFPRRMSIRHSTNRIFEKPARDAVRRSSWRPVPWGEDIPNIKACRTFSFILVPIPPEEREPISVLPQPPVTDRN